MINMELYRISRRPVFWLLILVCLGLAIYPVIQTWPHGVTDGYYIFYPRGAYIGWMPFISQIYSAVYPLIFPLLASIVYADAYAEDFNTGFIKSVLTKVNKKRYLMVRYVVNFCMGGAIVIFPLIINLMGEMAAYPLIDNNLYFGMQVVVKGSFWPELFYHHPFAYIGVRLLLLFLLGGMLASLGLAFSTAVKNRYIVLIFPFLFLMGLDTLVFAIDQRYSIEKLFLTNVQGNWGIPIYLVFGIVGSFIWFYVAGEKNETI